MPSKYDAILPGIATMPVVDQSYQDKVDAAKVKLQDLSAADLAAEYARMDAAKEDILVKLYAANLRIEAITQLLVASQDANGEGWGDYGVADNAIRLPSGATIRVQPEITGQVKDKEAYRLWCIKNGYETRLQLWPTTTNAIVKERLMAGEPEPDGVQAFRRNKLVFTEGKS